MSSWPDRSKCMWYELIFYAFVWLFALFMYVAMYVVIGGIWIFVMSSPFLWTAFCCLECICKPWLRHINHPITRSQAVSLENYCYWMKNTLQEEKLQDKFDAGDKDKIESAVQECLDWLERNQMAETEEFEAKQKELEGVVNPIMMKVYQSAGGGGMPDMGGMGGGAPPGGAGGPTVEEVD